MNEIISLLASDGTTVRFYNEIKASGGIRNYEDAMAMIEAGATRLGASKGVEIMEGEKVDDLLIFKQLLIYLINIIQ